MTTHSTLATLVNHEGQRRTLLLQHGSAVWPFHVLRGRDMFSLSTIEDGLNQPFRATYRKDANRVFDATGLPFVEDQPAPPAEEEDQAA